MTVMTEERRVVEMELKVEEGDGKTPVLSGYAAVFGRKSLDLGGFTEEIAPGAFRNTITTEDVVGLVDHDPIRIVGRKSAGTLRLEEDTTGLRMEIDLPGTSVGRDIAESVRRGDVKGASFGFRTIADEWRTEDRKPHRILKEVKLRDVGPVTFPAYPDTAVAMRSLEQWQSAIASDLKLFEMRQRHARALGR